MGILGEPIKKFSGEIIGWIATAPNGDKTLRDFYGKILGYYRKAQNVTTEFSGWIVGKGDILTSLL